MINLLKLLRPYFLVLIISFVASQIQADEAEKGKLFQGSSASIYYETQGNSTETPLFVLHGGPGFEHRYFHYSNAFETISQQRKVIYYDQRGCGQSPRLKDADSFRLIDQIADLDELRAHLGYAKMDVLGHSWGGFLAIAYAARHPERINKLILCDSVAPKWSDTIFLFSQVFPESRARENADSFAAELGDQAAIDRWTKEYLPRLFYSPTKRDSFLQKASSLTYQEFVNSSVHRDIGRFDLSHELLKFQFPTLIITGRYDMNVAPLVAYKFHKAIVGSQFVVFEQSGHLPFFEEPDEFAKVMEQFLSQGKK